MIIKQFLAKGVHGYIDFDISFNEDLSFVVGHNGCGKTTALKLVVALLNPSIKDLASISFDSCSIEYAPSKGSKPVIVRAVKNKFAITLTIASTKISKYEFQLEDVLDEHFEDPDLSMVMSKNSKPIFISLDRKFANNSFDYDQRVLQSLRFNDEMSRHYFSTDKDPLSEVKKLIKNEIRGVERKNIHENERLKDKILIDAFKIVSVTNTFDFEDLDLDELDTKRKYIAEALENMSLRSKNLSDVIQATDTFFYELRKNVNELREIKEDELTHENPKYMEAITFLYVNKPQITRIDSLVKFIQRSQEQKKAYYDSINSFENIVNSFFKQTGKKISIRTGLLKILYNEKEIEAKSLSSGETQIITLFAHVIFNRKRLSKATFIIDEPELSLHLAWQEMFVESLKAANSNLQIILATHSPAIINGLDENCVFVNKEHVGGRF
ncbi:AAA family ATPase [Shewanella sp. 125m-7]